MKHDKNISIYPFDERLRFVLIKAEDAIQKIEEQIGKSKITDHYRTPTLLNIFQKGLARLRKENKFNNKANFKLYSSDEIPP